MNTRAWMLFLALGIIWGMPYLLIRIAVEDLHPVIVAFGRTAVGALVLLPFAFNGSALSAALRHWKWLLVYTLFEITGPWVLIAYAETRLTSSTAGLIVATTPLIAAAVVAGLGHERIEPRRLLGLALGLCGVAGFMGADIRPGDMPAMLALILSAVGYAIGPIIAARKLSHIDPIGVVTGSLILAFLIYLPAAPFFWPATVSAASAWSVVGLGLLCTAIAFVLLFALIAEVGPARSTVIAYVNPAIALLLGVVILNEPLTIGMAIGFPLIIIGSILGTAGRKASTPRR